MTRRSTSRMPIAGGGPSGSFSHSPARAHAPRHRPGLARIAALLALAALPLAGCAPRPAGTAPSPARTPAPPQLSGAFAPDSSHTERLASGVTYTEMHIPSGPWLVHLVQVAPNARGVELRTVKALDRVVGRERPSEMARRTAAKEGRHVIAAVNADFFNFHPPGVSEGPQVSGGRVVKSEDDHRAAVPDTVLREQPVFGVSGSGEPFFGDAHLAGWVRVDDAAPAPLTRVNRPADPDSLTLYNSYMGERTPADSGAVELIVRTVRPAAMAGDTAVGVVVRVDTLPEGVAIPADGVVLAERASAGAGSTSARSTNAAMANAAMANAAMANAAMANPAMANPARARAAVPQPGDSVWWSLPFRGAPARVKELTGGYPMLLRNGESVLGRFDDMIPGFSVKEHPRTAVALRPDGTVLLVAVDGRSESSGGMSLPQLTDFLKALGATDALNLDGGGSTVLALDGQVVSHPSDKEGERPVSTALLVLGPK